ncbi:homoserine dehydrogenase [Candidatus Carsonella ruddii]|uniref:homoserine dehydrogenase n=1 Tax=Candidatus Carsonella ruddii HC isolate Thao2000 TaxID=1202538 RepID=J3YQ55_CARRU|nr:homoserine dehydrogenase [Candidatus Carsonella ruddii]AFP83988.1 homoserine dehydrogenase [Candidatus Carsonella ruddii HC isolate Thao2000]
MNFSIFGLGNVGSVFYNNFSKKNNFLTFSKNNKFNCNINNNSNNYINLFKNNHLFIELIGNIEISIEIILNSIKKNNNFITANKDLISKYIFLINFLFKKNKLKTYYEASTCGVIPIIKLLNNFYFKDKFLYLFGVLNGTCNYILSNIKNINFLNLIKISIKKGIAEKQYSNDIFGIDTVFKTSIIISKINNYNIFYYNIYLESIFNINKFVRKIFYYKKFISYYYNLNNYIFLNISLFFLKNKILKYINNSYNFLILNGIYSKKTLLLANGAGGLPTSYSVFSNLHYSFKKNFFLKKKCNNIIIINKNFFCFNFLLKINFCYNIFYYLFILKIIYLKIYYKKYILIKTKKTYYKKILFFLYFFKNKKFFFNKIL